jgi:hypothetical protein
MRRFHLEVLARSRGAPERLERVARQREPTVEQARPAARRVPTGSRQSRSEFVPSGILSVVLLLWVGILGTGCGARDTTTAHGPARNTQAPAPSTTAAPAPRHGRPCGAVASPPAHYAHVVWIWMENHTWSSVINSSEAPYLETLAHECGTDTQYSDVGSPSLPNYLGATSGSTQGVSDDADPVAHRLDVDNLFQQVRVAGGTERSFVESMPSPCRLVSEGPYAAKHNPGVYYVNAGDRASCQADNLPFSDFESTLAHGTLPTYTSITPNLCDDMHDCSVATGDQWLATWVPRILTSPTFETGTTALVIVFDEPTPLANVVVAPSMRPGTVSAIPVNHFSLLRATEEMLGLPLLDHAATATSLRAVFHI